MSRISPVDAEDVDPLRRSQHTVNETHQLLPLGRGNSAADLAATDWQNLQRVKVTKSYFDNVVLPEALPILESHPGGADDPELVAHATMVAHAGLAPPPSPCVPATAVNMPRWPRTCMPGSCCPARKRLS